MSRVAGRGGCRNRMGVADSPATPEAPMFVFATGRGRPLPLGVTLGSDGHNFALLCRHGTRVTLVILPEEGGDDPLAEFPLHPSKNRTGDHWHIRVAGLPPTFCYG